MEGEPQPPRLLQDGEFQALWETYYPVIVHAREVRDRYFPIIDGKREPTIVCPDESQRLIDALNVAEKKYFVMPVELPKETHDGEEKKETEEGTDGTH